MENIRVPDIKEQAERDYISGMKYKDIAAKYDVSLNTVKSWKTRYKWNRNGEKQWECYVGAELNDIEIDNLDNIYVVGSKLGLCKFNSIGEKLWRKNDFTAKRIILIKINICMLMMD